MRLSRKRGGVISCPLVCCFPPSVLKLPNAPEGNKVPFVFGGINVHCEFNNGPQKFFLGLFCFLKKNVPSLCKGIKWSKKVWGLFCC